MVENPDILVEPHCAWHNDDSPLSEHEEIELKWISDIECSDKCIHLHWHWKQYFSVPHRFLQDSKDSSGLHYNLSDFELEENNSVKSSGILRTGTEFG